jgi:uncharacterized RDD family membrane protein YckC
VTIEQAPRTEAASATAASLAAPAPPVEPVSISRRLLAALYDFPALLLLAILGTALLLLANGGARLDESAVTSAIHRTTLIGLWIGYYGISWTRGGQTLGMKVWRFRVVRLDGAPLCWSDALLRLAVAMPAWLPLGIGLIAAAWDTERRSWHDRWSRTRLVSQFRS